MTSVLHLTDDTENKIICNLQFGTCNQGQGFSWYHQKKTTRRGWRAALKEGKGNLAGREVLSPQPSFPLRAIRPALGNTEGHVRLAQQQGLQRAPLAPSAIQCPPSDGRRRWAVRMAMHSLEPSTFSQHGALLVSFPHSFPSRFVMDSSISRKSLLPASRSLSN